MVNKEIYMSNYYLVRVGVPGQDKQGKRAFQTQETDACNGREHQHGQVVNGADYKREKKHEVTVINKEVYMSIYYLVRVGVVHFHGVFRHKAHCWR